MGQRIMNRSFSSLCFPISIGIFGSNQRLEMRKHGRQLPHHPLQVVAVAIFLALGFAFHVFFVPCVGKKLFEYVVMGTYTPLVRYVFCLFVWCAATDCADPGVFKSKKCHQVESSVKQTQSTQGIQEA